jgi:hypothetical protein
VRRYDQSKISWSERAEAEMNESVIAMKKKVNTKKCNFSNDPDQDFFQFSRSRFLHHFLHNASGGGRTHTNLQHLKTGARQPTAFTKTTQQGDTPLVQLLQTHDDNEPHHRPHPNISSSLAPHLC